MENKLHPYKKGFLEPDSLSATVFPLVCFVGLVSLTVVAVKYQRIMSNPLLITVLVSMGLLLFSLLASLITLELRKMAERKNQGFTPRKEKIV